MTLREMLSDIHALEEEMLAFERKYGVRSETFYAAYVSGEEPEDDGGYWTSRNGPASIGHGSPDKLNTAMRSSGFNPIRRAWLD